MSTHERDTPGLIGRIRSKQAGRPSGLLGRAIGRLMVKDTAHGNDRNLELLGDVEGLTVLDLGFGQGRTVQLLTERGAKVLGSEVSRTMLMQATRRNRRAIAAGKVDLRISDGITIPFDTNSIDAITTAHTIYFWPDPQATLADMCRVLKPGGSLTLAYNCSDDGVPDWMDPDVYTMYTMFEVIKMLEVAGFVDVEAAGAGDARPAMRWVRATNPVA